MNNTYINKDQEQEARIRRAARAGQTTVGALCATDGDTTGVVTLGASPASDSIDVSAVADVRSVEILTSNGDTNYTATITKADGSTVVQTVFTGAGNSAWAYFGQRNEASITTVEITNNTATPVDYILNYVSVK